jgi:hypothetical protein
MPEKGVAQKLLIKPGYRVLLAGAPPGYPEALGPLPADAAVLMEATTPVDLILAFTRSKQELENQLASLRAFLGTKTLL